MCPDVPKSLLKSGNSSREGNECTKVSSLYIVDEKIIRINTVNSCYFVFTVLIVILTTIRNGCCRTEKKER